eukprot:1657956-Alexandrium_andersonii.AAC.1
MTAKEVEQQYKSDAAFKAEFEEFRTSVIQVVANQSSNRLRITAPALDAARESVKLSTQTASKRSKTGLEFTKTAFEKRFKDRPDILKKAKYYPYADQNGKVSMRTKVFDDELEEGVYRFEESERQVLAHEQVLDNGETVLEADQLTK